MLMGGKPKIVEISDEQIEKIMNQSETFYKSLSEIFCPYLKAPIYFNSKGWEHLRFKSRSKARNKKEQYLRLKLVKYAPEIISKSHTLQGIWQTNEWEPQKSHGK